MKRVLLRPMYGIFGLISSLLIYTCITTLPAIPVLVAIFTDPFLFIDEKITFTASLIADSLKPITLYDFVYAAVVAVATGLNITFLVFYYRMYRATSPAVTGSVFGSVTALLGFGCAACGSVFLAALARTIGGASVFTLLPHGGQELGYLGILILIASTLSLVRAINTPPTCPI